MSFHEIWVEVVFQRDILYRNNLQVIWTRDAEHIPRDMLIVPVLFLFSCGSVMTDFAILLIVQGYLAIALDNCMIVMLLSQCQITLLSLL